MKKILEDTMSEESKIRDTADAVKGIVEAIPIYQDALQPAAKEIGQGLQTVAKTIHIALAPISALVWGYDQIREFVNIRVTEKLKNVPEENITTPKPNIAGPALEALKYTGHDENLQEMYANLLATSMDTRTADGAHPAFVEIIRQLTSDEARLVRLFIRPRALPLLNVRWEYIKETETERGGQDVLSNFSLLGVEAQCQLPDLTPTYIDNLCRLGLVVVPTFFEYTAQGIYEPLENHPKVLSVKEKFDNDDKRTIRLERKGLRVTDFGRQFCEACVLTHDQKGLPKKNMG